MILFRPVLLNAQAPLTEDERMLLAEVNALKARLASLEAKLAGASSPAPSAVPVTATAKAALPEPAPVQDAQHPSAQPSNKPRAIHICGF